jgi:2-methylisocitrate lyase-like PEP mutase family enzyme
VGELERLGVRRVSVGSGPMRATLALTARIARELLDAGTYASFSDAIPSAEVQRLFKEQK